MTTHSTQEFETLVQEAFKKMKDEGADEVTFGPGFILVRNPDVRALESRGEVLQSFSIEDVPLAVLSPDVRKD